MFGPGENWNISVNSEKTLTEPLWSRGGESCVTAVINMKWPSTDYWAAVSYLLFDVTIKLQTTSHRKDPSIWTRHLVNKHLTEEPQLQLLAQTRPHSAFNEGLFQRSECWKLLSLVTTLLIKKKSPRHQDIYMTLMIHSTVFPVSPAASHFYPVGPDFPSECAGKLFSLK